MSKTEKVFPLNTFGGRIQHRRKEILKMSRPEFYDLIYPNENIATESKSRTVKNWESGKNEPDIRNLKKICSALKCSSDYLLGLDECTDKSTQFIHECTGLSEIAVKRLHEFTTYHQGEIRLAVIDFFLQDIHFAYSLTDMVNDYFGKYYRYKTNEKIFFQEDEEQRRLEFIEFLTYTSTVSRKKLKEYEDVKDAAHFNVQKEFDNILENLMKHLYDKYSDKTPDAN